ncbi:MAG: porin family protein, partial [Bacteroidota bacterium]|nr:porin family protein [Bacteroidota bacterium]
MIAVAAAFSLLLLLSTTPLPAQTGVRFGLKGGYSMSLQYGITPVDNRYTVSTSWRHAAAGGFMLHYPITESFAVQQEFMYVMKGSRHDIGIPADGVQTLTLYDINYFEIPLVFRYIFLHLGDYKVYGNCGWALSILLNGRVELDGTVEEDGALISFRYADRIRGLDDFDYGFIYGLGVEAPFFGRDWFFEYRFTI